MEDDDIFEEYPGDYSEPDPDCETCGGEGGEPYCYIGADPEEPLWAYPPCEECGGTGYDL